MDTSLIIFRDQTTSSSEVFFNKNFRSSQPLAWLFHVFRSQKDLQFWVFEKLHRTDSSQEITSQNWSFTRVRFFHFLKLGLGSKLALWYFIEPPVKDQNRFFDFKNHQSRVYKYPMTYPPARPFQVPNSENLPRLLKDTQSQIQEARNTCIEISGFGTTLLL